MVARIPNAHTPTTGETFDVAAVDAARRMIGCRVSLPMRLLWNPLLPVALLGPAIAVPALAQQEPSNEYPAACDAASVTNADVERAHTVFLSGKQFLAESNYDKAISYFKDAYTIDCSVHAILPIIATALERKGDKAAAIRVLEEYLKRAPSAVDREVIERRIKNLTEQLPREPIVPAPSAKPTATATAASAPPVPTPTAPADPPPAVALRTPVAAPEAEHTPHSNPGPWVVVGLGAAVALSSIGLFAAGASEVSSASDKCPTRKGCTPAVATQGNNGRNLETLGGVAAVVGPVVVGAGLLWYFFGNRSVPATPSVAVAPGYVALGVDGAF